MSRAALTGWRGWLAAALAVGGLALSFGVPQAQQTPGSRPNTTEVRKSKPVDPSATAATTPVPPTVPPAAVLRPSVGPESERSKDSDAGAAAPAASTALSVDIAATQKTTTVTIALTQQVSISAFAVPDPYRVIVDVADLDFKLPATLPSRGLVTGLRYGLLSPGQSRVVMDTAGPVRIVRAEVVPSLTAGAGVQLVVVLEATDRAQFLAAMQLPETGTPAPGPDTAAQPKTDRPVVVIDPGHGGLDPGALGQNGIREKDLTLAVARQVRSQLAAKGRLDVRLTRPGDSFIALDQRVVFSRTAGASLFVSIHADSVGDTTLAQAVRGASVYTLSAEASHKQAKVLAEKENSADLRAGLTAAAGAGGDQIKSILFDLMSRETQNFSSEIRSLLVSNLKRSVALAREPARSAAFKVLQQTHAPSVLVELGYLSHTEDAALLQSPEWQRQVAASIVAAIEQYFSRHGTAKP